MKKLLIVAWICCAQSGMAQMKDWTYFGSFNKESIFYPSKYNFENPVHPGFSIGTDILIKKRLKTDRLLSIEFGHYHHKYLQNGYFLLAGYQIKMKAGQHWSFWTQPQMGYLHTFSPTGEFELKNGQYKKKKSGRPSIMAGISLGIDYQIIDAYKTRVFISYKAMAEGPFAIEYGVPAVPHTFLTIGLKSKLFSK